MCGGCLLSARALPPYGPVISLADRTRLIAVWLPATASLAHRTTRMLFLHPPLRRHTSASNSTNRASAVSRRHRPGRLAPPEPCRDEGDSERLRNACNDDSRMAGPGVGSAAHADIVALFARSTPPLRQHQLHAPPTRLPHPLPRLAPTGHAELFAGNLRAARAAPLYTARGVLKYPSRQDADARRGLNIRRRRMRRSGAKANDYRWFDLGGIRETPVSFSEDERSTVHADNSSVQAVRRDRTFRYRRMSKSSLRRVAGSLYDLLPALAGGPRLVNGSTSSCGFRSPAGGAQVK